MTHPRVIRGDFIVKAPNSQDLLSYIDGVLIVHDLTAVTAVAEALTVSGALQKPGAYAVAFTIAASETTDGLEVSAQVVDQDGEDVAGVHTLLLGLSDDAAGAGLTTNDLDTDLAATAGAIIVVHEAYKLWLVQTDDTGLFSGLVIDDTNTADLVFFAKNPGRDDLSVSDPTVVTDWEGGGA